jgi:hypothetical protein
MTKLSYEEIQKFLDDNNITLEEYLRENMITDEERKYVDKIWVDEIYRNFEDT